MKSTVAPSRLVLEMTESVLVDNPDEAKLRLDALRGLGVKIALDDFGTGYSSLELSAALRLRQIEDRQGLRHAAQPLGQ